MKKIITKMVLFLIVIVMVLPMTAFTDSVDSKRSMDELDIILVAHRFMSGISGTDGLDLWDNITGVKEIVDLYDIYGNVIAYYISFEPNGYAIVNNNLDNPIAIEFGEGDNYPIRNIIDSMADKTVDSASTIEICYAGPTGSFLRSELATYQTEAEFSTLKHALDIMYTELSQINEEEKALHEKRRVYAIENAFEIGIQGGEYDFIKWDDMPSGTYTSGWLPFYGTTWAVMQDFEDIANNHCGATAATNIALYFATTVNPNIKKNNSVRDTFIDLHSRIGNGPVLNFNNELKAYISSRGSTLNYSAQLPNTFSEVKKAIGERRPLSLLLMGGPFNYHWIVGVGYREYDNGEKYVRVVTGWENSANNFWYFHPPLLVWMFKYWAY